MNINDPTCSPKSKPDKLPTCVDELEHFGTPEGISQTKDGEWCYKTGDYCVTSDGKTVNLANKTVNKLRKDLKAAKNTCNAQVQSIADSLKCKEDAIQTSTASGPCLTTDNQWGVILPQYGKKCVPMSTINKETLKKKIVKGVPSKDADKDEDESKLGKKEINNRFNALLAKQKATSTQADDRMMNLRRYDGSIDKCLPKDTNFNKLCQKKYGAMYHGEAEKCTCPLTHSALCDQFDLYKAECYCTVPDDKQYTDCKPSTADFNYWCQSKYGRNYGYTKILKGRDGCCGKNDKMARKE